MSRSPLTYLLLIPIAFMLMGARATPLVDPDPIAVPSGVAVKDVSKAIRAGIATRGWVVNKDEKGVIDAVLNNRGHTARVAINYDAKQVKISYVSSDNLNYSEKKGGRYIHPNYLKWIQNMVGDISRELQLASIKHE
jgi:hypothetical protein